tara:strand:- start:11 stop:361 length:351 start_codon:yes stop_codon:yes gene_type:complete
MVHKNYKWNISKERGEETLDRTITAILKGNIDNIIEMDELSFLINNRTKDLIIKNHNKKKNMMNFVKNVIGGLIIFIENNDKYILEKKGCNMYIKLKNPHSEINLCDWIFVDDESY